jgi:hypothetical protein
MHTRGKIKLFVVISFNYYPKLRIAHNETHKCVTQYLFRSLISLILEEQCSTPSAALHTIVSLLSESLRHGPFLPLRPNRAFLPFLLVERNLVLEPAIGPSRGCTHCIARRLLISIKIAPKH